MNWFAGRLILSPTDWSDIFSNRKFVVFSYAGISIGLILCAINGIPHLFREGALIPSFYTIVVFLALFISAAGIYFRYYYLIPLSIIIFNLSYVAANTYQTFYVGLPIQPVTVSYSVMYYIINAIMFRLSFVFILNAIVFVFIFSCSIGSLHLGGDIGGPGAPPFLINAVILSAAGFLLQHLVLTVRAMLIEQLGAMKLQVLALEAEMELETARKDAREKAIQLNRISVVEALGASIAHEINQPIAAALTYCQATRNWSAIECRDAPETLQALAGVEANVDRAARLIENIRLLTTNKDRSYALTNVCDLVQDQVNLINSEFERRGIKLVFAAANTELTAMICPSEVALATMNLLRNAMEAFDEPTTRSLVSVGCKRTEEEWIEIDVVDNGQGLSPEGIQMAFSAFQTTKEKGAGIGLSICQEVAEHHSGSISIAVNPNGGVTATLRLAIRPEIM